MDIKEYCDLHSKSEDIELKYISDETATYTELPQMHSGHNQGKFLMMLVSLVNPKRILELGTFTGYSALAMAKASSKDTVIHTCDVNLNTAKIARKHFDNSAHGHRIIQLLGPALKSIDRLNMSFDFIFIDADKLNYPNYLEKLIPKLNVGGLMVLDNMLWRSEVLNPQKPSAKGVDKANKMLRDNKNLDNVMLNYRDGIQVVRKIK